jgi:hypothetical protein
MHAGQSVACPYLATEFHRHSTAIIVAADVVLTGTRVGEAFLMNKLRCK